MPPKFKIHEIPDPKPGELDEPVIVRYKASDKGDFITSENFRNFEIKIDQKDLVGLDDIGIRELIQTRIKEHATEVVVSKMDLFRNLQKFENEEFDFETKK